MTLAADIYTVLNTNWVTGTIAKPVFKVNPLETDEPIYPRNCIIRTAEGGHLEPEALDNKMDVRTHAFSIELTEGSEADLVKSIIMVRNLLLNASITSGEYHIDDWKEKHTDKLWITTLIGSETKLLASTDW